MEDSDITPYKGQAAASEQPNFQSLHPPPIHNGARPRQPRPTKVEALSTALSGGGTSPYGSVAAPSPRSVVPRPPNSARSVRDGIVLVDVTPSKLHNKPRSAARAILPQVSASTPAHVVLDELDRERQTAEEEGEYLKAHNCLEVMKALAEQCGRTAERQITSQRNPSEVAERSSHYRVAMLEFTQLWEETFRDYERKAEAAILDLQSEQQRQLEEAEQLARSELAVKRPHYSRKAITKREELEQLIGLRQYKEAERVRRDLVVFEEADEKRFEESLNTTLSSKMKIYRQQQEKKLHALKKRISQGREELTVQRRVDYGNLLLRHANGIEETHQKHKNAVAVERRNFSKQMEAQMVRSATKSTNFQRLLSGY